VKRWLAAESYAAAEDPHHDHRDDHGHPHGGDRHDVNRHDARIRAVTLATDTPIPAASFEMFIDLLRSLTGRNSCASRGHCADRRRSRTVPGDSRRAAGHASAVRFDTWPRCRPSHPYVIITRTLNRIT